MTSMPTTGTLRAVASAKPPRVASIDAARGFIMLTMIFVNDFAGVSDEIAPWWMKHYSDMHPRPAVEDGMTFVDMVFPGFLFMVGMSIPFALGGRLTRGEKWWQLLPHILIRTLSLLLLGILMVNGESGPNHAAGLSQSGWAGLMFLAAILAFAEIRPFFVKKGDAKREKLWKIVSWLVRGIGLAGLVALMLLYENVRKNHRTGAVRTQHIVEWSPFVLRTSWYGILGLIAWAYLAGSLVYLIFRNSRLALAICGVLMMGMYAADRTGSLRGFHLPGFLAPIGVAIAGTCTTLYRYIGNGFNTSGGIVVAGTILATILLTPDTATVRSRIKFTLWFILATALLAMVFYKPYLIWKNSGTPAWGLWACVFTATLWLLFYVMGDVLKWTWITKPFAIAGQNVLFAYLLSEGIVSWMDQARLGDWYGGLGEHGLALAIVRSLGLGILLLAFTSLMNWLGVRLKL